MRGLLLLAVLAAPALGQTLPPPDLSLLRPWTPALESAEPQQAPYVARFRHGRKQLFYIAADHSSGLQSGTFKTVREVLARFAPQALILEGVHVDDPASEKSYLEYVDGCARERFVHCGEPSYAASLAHGLGIPFTGGEPSDEEILKELVRQGYTARDMAGFYLFRQVPSWRRHGQLDEAGFAAQAERFLNGYRARFGEDFGYKEFLSWYESHAAKGASILAVSYDDTAPLDGPGATYFQAISYKVSLVREARILGRVEEQLRRHDRVLIVYGKSHLVTERKTLEKMLGKPENLKLF